MADRTMKRNDTHPDLIVTCYDDGVAADLSGYTCTLTMTLQGAGSPTLNKVALSYVTDGTNGQLTRTWSASDTATEGTYNLEVEAVNGTDVITYPTSGYFTLQIVADLA